MEQATGLGGAKGVARLLKVKDVSQKEMFSGRKGGKIATMKGRMAMLYPWWCCRAGASSGQHNPVLRKPTLTRLQAAGQQLLLAGRATTGAMRSKAAAGCGGGHDVLALAAGSSDGSRRFGDRAAVAALKGAAMLDPVAPLKCPAALLLDVKGPSPVCDCPAVW